MKISFRAMVAAELRALKDLGVKVPLKAFKVANTSDSITEASGMSSAEAANFCITMAAM